MKANPDGTIPNEENCPKKFRVYLEVPEGYRAYVRELGAAWDAQHGHWYVRKECDDYRLTKFVTDRAQTPLVDQTPRPRRKSSYREIADKQEKRLQMLRFFKEQATK